MPENQVQIRLNKDIMQFEASICIDGIEYYSTGGSPIEAYDTLMKELGAENE